MREGAAVNRSGYSDDCENWDLIRWRGAVASALGGKRGQATLREIAAALDALPTKELIAESLVNEDGAFCTLGALGHARGIDMTLIDAEDRQSVAEAFGIAEAMAAEIMFVNDKHVDDWKWIEIEICGPMRPHYPDYGRHTRMVHVSDDNAAARRWTYMRSWVAKQLIAP